MDFKKVNRGPEKLPKQGEDSDPIIRIWNLYFD